MVCRKLDPLELRYCVAFTRRCGFKVRITNSSVKLLRIVEYSITDQAVVGTCIVTIYTDLS
jgi:hypothetical protein